MEIILFGQLADIAGSSRIEIEPAKNTHELSHLLETRYPALAGVRYIIAVNKQLVTEQTLLQGNETIALMPPFSGG
jgi:sulfur-carrier protein